MDTKKTRILVSLTLFLISLSAGCGPSESTGKFTEEEMEAIPMATTDHLPEPSGGLVLSVYTETITAEEVILMIADELKSRAKLAKPGFKAEVRNQIAQIVQSKVLDILLYQQARKNSPDNIDDALEKAVEKEVNQFVADYGGNYAEAQKEIIRSGFTDWGDFRDYKKKLILTQSYLSSELEDNTPITHSELLDYYNLKKDEFFQWAGKLEFRLIDIQIDTMSSKAAAMAKAELVFAKLSAGDDFAVVAKQYSDGLRAADGGLWADVTIGNLAEPYDILEIRSEKMKSDEICEPIATDSHIFIMKLISRKDAGSQPFEDVQGKIEKYVRLQRQRNKFDEVVAGFIEQANIADMDRFIDSCTETACQRYGI
jgi:parvulin-like peptidyl-prolyl isomerase